MKAHKQDNNDTRIALLEQSQCQVVETLKEIRSDIREVKTEINSLRDQIFSEFKNVREHVDSRLDRINNRLWSLMFFIVAGGSSILYIIAKSNHWLA